MEKGFMQYRCFVICLLTLLLQQNSKSFGEHISFSLYCMKPVLAVVFFTIQFVLALNGLRGQENVQ